MRAAAGDYQIDDDPARIDAEAVVSFLTTQAYWARWRGGEDIRRQIAAAWRVVGGYDRAGVMVGFARAFSDDGQAYLADVYVLPGHRGRGLAKAIIAMMIEDGPGSGLRWMLHTSDAHGLYRQFGFARPDHRYLERPAREQGGSGGPGGPGWEDSPPGSGGQGGLGGWHPPRIGGIPGGRPPGSHSPSEATPDRARTRSSRRRCPRQGRCRRPSWPVPPSPR